ncbi:transposase [Crocinitomicaceae bacterium CZZ-1]|uniref:Transposase n=1 Tax=Taishania pollutisoli TaxID=2766479 RepID=A0A8J6PP12_9FLAO|nr:transposase [Taishania pollutisoli]MBC9814010.1 transposase [Taishania pollutisoli]
MKKARRVFSPEDRLSILEEAKREGQAFTCRKYNLSPSLVDRWKKKYLSQGIKGLQPSYHKVDPEKRALEEENARLRRIIANQALELEVKSELLKKTPIGPGKRS